MQPPILMIDDLILDTVDLTSQRYRVILCPGFELYRICLKDQPPLKPTGRYSSFVSEPPNFDPVRYSAGMCAGTGATYYAKTLSTAEAEKQAHGDLTGCVAYKITIQQEIQLLNLDVMCQEQNIVKPYMTEKKEAVLDQFYGRHVKGVMYESRQDAAGYSIVIFNDWFTDFENRVKVEPVKTY